MYYPFSLLLVLVVWTTLVSNSCRWLHSIINWDCYSTVHLNRYRTQIQSPSSSSSSSPWSVVCCVIRLLLLLLLLIAIIIIDFFFFIVVRCPPPSCRHHSQIIVAATKQIISTVLKPWFTYFFLLLFSSLLHVVDTVNTIIMYPYHPHIHIIIDHQGANQSTSNITLSFSFRFDNTYCIGIL